MEFDLLLTLDCETEFKAVSQQGGFECFQVHLRSMEGLLLDLQRDMFPIPHPQNFPGQ
jgi:hypothetical protein